VEAAADLGHPLLLARDAGRELSADHDGGAVRFGRHSHPTESGGREFADQVGGHEAAERGRGIHPVARVDELVVGFCHAASKA